MNGLKELPRGASVAEVTPLSEWDRPPQVFEEGDNDFFGDGPYMGTGTAFDTDEAGPVYTPPPSP